MHVTVSEDHLKKQVIRPTLKNLGFWSASIEAYLLSTAVNAPKIGLFSLSTEGLGIFRITSDQHREIWDKYLAYNPDLASRVRGLASQHAFLRDPDGELQTNLSYCTAIAWLLYRQSTLSSEHVCMVENS
ncbi:MAG: hypothetical protein GY703_22775 [Gammaproteobacteria bacterium]|nr:hypothetical protein [Gammaproteobacteria bacterium]